MKFIKKLTLLLLVFIIGCQNQNNNSSKNKDLLDSKVVVKNINYNNISFEDLPEETNENKLVEEKIEISDYIKKNNIFSNIPYKIPDKYLVKFSGDGSPVFLSGDGSPVFFTKANNSIENGIIWSRAENKLLLDYLHILNKIELNGEKVSFGKYSQVIEHDFSVDNNGTKFSKKLNLVKSMGFSIAKVDNAFKMRSVTPIVFRKINNIDISYQIRSVTLVNEKNKVIIHDYKKLIPLPGISFKKHLNSNKFTLYVELAFNDSKKLSNKDIDIIASIEGKQVLLKRNFDGLYTTEITQDTNISSKGLVIEAIDKNSLTSDGEYNGVTWILPITE
ncbi:MAG: hypothetical protein U0457_21475 [Candidatus Sericytochromatia bacterium]